MQNDYQQTDIRSSKLINDYQGSSDTGIAMSINLPIVAVRLRERMEEIGVSQTTLADAIGVRQGTISMILTGQTKNSRHLPRIAENLAINLNWLLGLTDDKIDMFNASGEDISEDSLAAMKAGVVSVNLLHPEQLQPSSIADRRLAFHGTVPDHDQDVVEIDHVALHYGMGGSFLDGHREVAKRKFSRTWLREITTVAPEHLAWTKGDGDSMEPTIRDGEVVLIDRSKISPGRDDKIWAIAVGDVGMIKRLRALPNGVVEIHSDNPHVPIGTAVDGELHVIGRVIAVVRKL